MRHTWKLAAALLFAAQVALAQAPPPVEPSEPARDARIAAAQAAATAAQGAVTAIPAQIITAVGTETSRAQAAENALSASISTLSVGSVTPAQLTGAIGSETTRAQGAETAASAAAASAASAASTAQSTATAAQATANGEPPLRNTAIGVETSRAQGAEATNAAAAAAAAATANGEPALRNTAISSAVAGVTPGSIGAPTSAQLTAAINGITLTGLGGATPASVTAAVGAEQTRATGAEGLLIPLAQRGAASGVAVLDVNTTIGNNLLTPSLNGLSSMKVPAGSSYVPLDAADWAAMFGVPVMNYRDADGGLPCNGEADDTVALQAAENMAEAFSAALGSNFSSTVVPPAARVCNVVVGVVARGGAKWIGQGTDSTAFQQGSGATAAVFTVAGQFKTSTYTPIPDWDISDVGIFGSGSANTNHIFMCVAERKNKGTGDCNTDVNNAPTSSLASGWTPPGIDFWWQALFLDANDYVVWDFTDRQKVYSAAASVITMPSTAAFTAGQPVVLYNAGNITSGVYYPAITSATSLTLYSDASMTMLATTGGAIQFTFGGFVGPYVGSCFTNAPCSTSEVNIQINNDATNSGTVSTTGGTGGVSSITLTVADGSKVVNGALVVGTGIGSGVTIVAGGGSNILTMSSAQTVANGASLTFSVPFIFGDLVDLHYRPIPLVYLFGAKTNSLSQRVHMHGVQFAKSSGDDILMNGNKYLSNIFEYYDSHFQPRGYCHFYAKDYDTRVFNSTCYLAKEGGHMLIDAASEIWDSDNTFNQANGAAWTILDAHGHANGGPIYLHDLECNGNKNACIDDEQQGGGHTYLATNNIGFNSVPVNVNPDIFLGPSVGQDGFVIGPGNYFKTINDPAAGAGNRSSYNVACELPYAQTGVQQVQIDGSAMYQGATGQQLSLSPNCAGDWGPFDFATGTPLIRSDITTQGQTDINMSGFLTGVAPGAAGTATAGGIAIRIYTTDGAPVGTPLDIQPSSTNNTGIVITPGAAAGANKGLTFTGQGTGNTILGSATSVVRVAGGIQIPLTGLLYGNGGTANASVLAIGAAGGVAPGSGLQTIASGTVSGAIAGTPGLTLISGNTAATSLLLPGSGPVTAAYGVGSVYGVADADGEAATFPITISTSGSAKINGASSSTINWAYGSLFFEFDGANWHTLPNLNLGGMARQNAGGVAITGGSIDGTTIGATTPANGTFTGLKALPYIDAKAAFDINGLAIGDVTPSTGVFTGLTLSGAAGGTLGYAKINSSGVFALGTLGGMGLQNAGSVAITGGTLDGTPVGATTPAGGTFSVLKLPSCTGYFYANAASAGTCSTTVAFPNLSGAQPIDLIGTSASLGGSSLAAFNCVQATVTVTGASASASPPQVSTTSPATYPGDAFQWSAYISAGNTVKVKLCNITSAAATPTASIYGVRVQP